MRTSLVLMLLMWGALLYSCQEEDVSPALDNMYGNGLVIKATGASNLDANMAMPVKSNLKASALVEWRFCLTLTILGLTLTLTTSAPKMGSPVTGPNVRTVLKSC